MKPRPYQKQGVAFLSKRKRSVLGDEMGVGKTPQMILTARKVKARKILVVAPSFLRINWFREFWKWHPRPETLDIQIIDNKRQEVHSEIVIVSYNLASDPGIHAQLAAERWDFMAVDEAHYLKTPGVGRTSRLLGAAPIYGKDGEIESPGITGLVRCAERTVFATGSPLVNHAGDLYTLAKRCAPRLLKSHGVDTYLEWCYKFCYVEQGFRDRFTPRRVRNPDLFKHLTGRFMIRRKKADVLPELPAKTKMIQELGPNAKIKELIRLERGHTVGEVIEMFERQQHSKEIEDVIGRHLDPMDPNPLATLRREMGLAKVPVIVEHLKNDLEQVEKVILFSYHKDVIAAVNEALGRYGVVEVSGRVSHRKKDQAVQAFQHDPKVRVFNGQLKAAGAGLTLTASSYVYFLEPWYVPGDIEQCIDRSHRFGQRDPVFAKFFIVPDSLDSQTLDTALDKQKYIDLVI